MTQKSEPRTARPAPRTPTPSRRSLAVAKPRDEMLTIPEVIEEIGVPRATFYRWRQCRKGPRAIKLPNGAVRIRRSELDRWLGALEEAA
ncbi:helix-turn-helix transcriptional regulator [Streptomyces lavendulae]|uniref:helix-turn-helix transcriptional regulator n=1 Tax=Streptomyces lavendulae TaxID=1914 RepID=UPI0036E7D491